MAPIVMDGSTGMVKGILTEVVATQRVVPSTLSTPGNGEEGVVVMWGVRVGGWGLMRSVCRCPYMHKKGGFFF